jgi:signal transduction histidine kinase
VDRRRSEHRLQLVIDTTPAMIHSARPDGCLDFFNKRWLEYLGVSWMTFWDGDGPAWFIPTTLRSSWTGGKHRWRLANPSKLKHAFDGLTENIAWRSIEVPLRDETGKIVKWYGSVIDIEDRRRAEEQLRQAQGDLARVTRVVSMGELAAAIAHEVNQPLTAIVTNGRFCLRRLDSATSNPDDLRAIGEIVSDGIRASAVISRIRSSLTTEAPNRTELDVNQVIQDVTILLRNEFTRDRVSLRTTLASDLPRVPGDPVQLQQVLINLIMNALEAMSSSTNGRRTILIRSAKSPDGVWSRFKILDQESSLAWQTGSLNHSIPRKRRASEWGCRSAIP